MTNSVERALEIDFSFIGFYFVQPIVNTRVRRDFVAAGIMEREEIVTLPLRTATCSAEQVAEVRDWAITEFYRRQMATVIPDRSQAGYTVLRALDQLPVARTVYLFGTARGAALLARLLSENGAFELGGYVDFERDGGHDGLPMYRVDRFADLFSPDTAVILSNQHVAANGGRLRARGFQNIFNGHPLVLALTMFYSYPAPRPPAARVFSRCSRSSFFDRERLLQPALPLKSAAPFGLCAALGAVETVAR
jgi:hypothetical protein